MTALRPHYAVVRADGPATATWKCVSRDAVGGLEYERLFGADADAARRHYVDAESHARANGGHVQLVRNSVVIWSYRGVAENE